MDSLTITGLCIMALLIFVGIGAARAGKAQEYLNTLPPSLPNLPPDGTHVDGVVYRGQGANSVPAYNRVGNLIYAGNGMGTPVYHIEGERIYMGSFGGFPVLTIMNRMVYKGQGTSNVPVATVVGEYAYPGNGITAAPLAYSPTGDVYLLAIAAATS